MARMTEAGQRLFDEKAQLADLIAEHRPNVVSEGTPSRERTRVKCDGPMCDFYAEHRRYWTAVQAHDAHLYEVISAYVDRVRAPEQRKLKAFRELAEEWQRLWDDPPQKWRYILSRTMPVLAAGPAAKRIRAILEGES